MTEPPTFAKRVQRLERDVYILMDPKWAITGTVTALLQCVREQQEALSRLLAYGNSQDGFAVDAVQKEARAVLARYELEPK